MAVRNAANAMDLQKSNTTRSVTDRRSVAGSRSSREDEGPHCVTFPTINMGTLHIETREQTMNQLLDRRRFLETSGRIATS